MSVELLIANTLRIANEDLEGARLLALGNNRNAVYLCEQAAEKVVRAVVTSEGKHAGIKHDLAEMVDLVPDDNPLKPLLRKIEHLSQYATAYRYPVSSSKTKRIPRPPAPDELQNALANTMTALLETAKAFEVDLQTADTPAGLVGPIR
ncbi:MAG TPA: HEPN domain-containing protein [Kofleriaceae bacterium]|nr:HEPN domain-containing protein [Kofleriaceae bacterium]